MNDALTVRANTPLEPANSYSDYRRQLEALDHLYLGTFGTTVFQRRDGVAITEAVLAELCQLPPRPTPTETSPYTTPTTRVRKPTVERHLADGLTALKAKGVKSVGQVLEYLKTPDGADLRALAQGVLKANPTKKGGMGKRTLRDVIKSAVAMRDRDRRDTTS